MWVGFENFLTIFDGAPKFFATISCIKCIGSHGDYSIADEQYSMIICRNSSHKSILKNEILSLMCRVTCKKRVYKCEK